MLAELSPARLRRSCNPARFTFATTAEVQASGDIVGQPRASAALRFGLGMVSFLDTPESALEILLLFAGPASQAEWLDQHQP
jgi:hypothetical protein